MKLARTFLLIALLFPTQSLFAQDSIDCSSNNRFELRPSLDSREIYIMFKDSRLKRKFLDGFDDFKHQCFLKELTDDSTKELIVRWSHKTQGTGIGSKEKGIQIWSIKEQKRLFKARTYCMFTGSGRKVYYSIKEKRSIKIQGKEIRIDSIESEYEGEWRENTHHCELDSIKPGNYQLGSAGLIKPSTTSYILSNETALLTFRTENDKKLVIAKDTANKYLIYRFGTLNKVELEYPSEKENSWKKFYYAFHSENAIINDLQKTTRYLYFTRGNYQYVVYQEYSDKRDHLTNGIKIIDKQTEDTTNLKAKHNPIKGSLLPLMNNEKIKSSNKSFD